MVDGLYCGGSTDVHIRDGGDISIYELMTCFGQIDSVRVQNLWRLVSADKSV